jgi:hypothetical protein
MKRLLIAGVLAIPILFGSWFVAIPDPPFAKKGKDSISWAIERYRVSPGHYLTLIRNGIAFPLLDGSG